MIGPALANFLGFVGMACIIAAYAYQTAKTHPNPFVQHGTNLVGAVLLTISLLVHTNLASLVLEAFWAAIALFGLGKAWLARSPPREGPGVAHSPSRLREAPRAGLANSPVSCPPPAPPASGRGEA